MKTCIRWYSCFILKHPGITLGLLTLFLAFISMFGKNFMLDASSDSLMLEDDQDLKYFFEIQNRYKTSPFVFVAYKPNSGDVFSELDRIQTMRSRFQSVEMVDSVLSILDAPLLKNPPVPISKVNDNIKTLSDPETDLELAEQELTSSPFYQNLVIDKHAKTTAFAIFIHTPRIFESVKDQRNSLRIKIQSGKAEPGDREKLKDLQFDYYQLKHDMVSQRHAQLEEIRSIAYDYTSSGHIYVTGVPAVADDMHQFVKKDIIVFSIVIILAIIVCLKLFFERKRWIFPSLLCCTYSILCMIGILGMFKWPVTVISSNFISLLLIMTMSLSIHLIVRYRELVRKNPDASSAELVAETVCSKLVPCLYTTLTTIAGFISLIICDIKPVKDFGMMMAMGLIISFFVSFLLFPALITFYHKETDIRQHPVGRSVTRFCEKFTEHHPRIIIVSTIVIIMLTGWGIAKLEVENSFINYFPKDTEIHRSMNFIDSNLGGTTPLDIIIRLPENESDANKPKKVAAEDSFFDEFDEFEGAAESEEYWFTPDKMTIVRKAHKYLETIPEIGHILSLATLLKITDDLNNDKPLEPFELALINKELPDDAHSILIDPYVDIEHNEFRLSMRIFDSRNNLKRNELLNTIQAGLPEAVNLPAENISVTGVMVLYNNMLQSLFSSQILTISVVFLILTAMFMILFRSMKIALIAMLPNLLSALSVLGILGLAGIPLDMMTITITAVSIGIAVDDTIHYIHRFSEEIEKDNDYLQAMRRCHLSVGSAMYFTSITIVAGFSLMAFSNFIPTMLFGLLTSAAMILALTAALTLLPLLIIKIKPFGK